MNEHATAVLDSYLDVERLAVPHAVLIEGRWGSGKTHFLQEIYAPARAQRMKAAQRPDVPLLFISLFGANSANEVERRIYRTALPGEAIAGGIAGTIVLSLAEAFRMKDTTKTVLDAVSQRAIRRLQEFVFVFDDLERMEKQAFGEIMGLINSFVAEHDRRVILVTDETRLVKLVDGDQWREQNEKFVGRRARIDPDLDGIIRASVARLNRGSVKDFMSDESDHLLEIAQMAKVENLRNVGWAVHNGFAFADHLLSDDDIPREHVALALHIVFAATLWLRSGSISPETLTQVPELSMKLSYGAALGKPDDKLDAPMAAVKAFVETFATLPIDRPPLDYRFITDFERSGVLDRLSLLSWIKSQHGFGPDFVEPTWRRLWYSHSRPMMDTATAILDLATELRDRVHTQMGALLHIFGLAIKQRDAGDTRLTAGEDVIEYFKRYVDDLAANAKLEAVRHDHYASMEAFGSLGFSARDTPEFDEIATYAWSAARREADRSLESLAGKVITDAEAGNFEALMQFVFPENTDLARMPVLMGISEDRLAELMSRDVPALYEGARMLAYRYHHAREGDPLLAEIGWARRVVAAVKSRLERWPDPYRAQGVRFLEGTIRHYEEGKPLDDRIVTDNVEADEAAATRALDN